MESRVRYGTHTKLHVDLYTSRVPLFAVLCQPSQWINHDTTGGASTFLGIYVLRQLTSTRTMFNIFRFSFSYMQMEWSRQ